MHLVTGSAVLGGWVWVRRLLLLCRGAPVKGAPAINAPHSFTCTLNWECAAAARDGRTTLAHCCNTTKRRIPFTDTQYGRTTLAHW